jgi:aspartate carbamoyltransferase regulatory subunit
MRRAGSRPARKAPARNSTDGTADPSYRVAKLRSGTALDHLPAGTALRCLALLGEAPGGIVTVGLNLPSHRLRRKDILKLEGRLLTPAELARMSLLGPRATVAFIEDFKVVRKVRLEMPTVLDGVVRCPNPSCITRNDRVAPRARVESADPLRLRCHYCERRILADEVEFLHG